MLLLQIPCQRIALIFLVVCLTLVSCKPAYEQTEHYASRADAVRDGAFDRGWLPEWLPRSSRDIWETHDLDSNRLFVKFVFDPKETEDFLDAAGAVPLNVSEWPEIPVINEPWWAEKFSMSHCYYVDHGDGESLLVLDQTTSTALLWSKPRETGSNSDNP